MNINYYLRQERKDGTKLIYINILYNKSRIAINTGLSIYPSYWDSSKQKVKNKHSLSIEYNNRLLDIKKNINSYYLKNNSITTNDLKSYIKSLLKPRNISETKFIEHYNEFLNNSKNKNTKRTYLDRKNTLVKLSDFASKSKLILDYNILDNKFFEGFIYYLKKDCKLSVNTSRKHFKILKTFLNFGIKFNYHNSLMHQHYTISEEETEMLFLDENQINKFLFTKLEQRDLVTAQDLAIFMYQTLQRYSDVKDFRFSDIKLYNNGKEEISYWNLKINKTNTYIKIPLREESLNIIKKYKELHYNELPVPTNQNLNKKLKKIGKLVGLDESVKIKNRTEVSHNSKLYEHIGCHTFRRSGITNLLVKGMNPEVIKRISGHTDMKSFQKYVKLADSVIFDRFLEV